MNILETIVIKSSRAFDLLAGLILAGTALLVVANVIGRTLLDYSILGTYEMVGFLTASAVGLSLARCAVENGHIAIEFILEKFTPRIQRLIEIVLAVPSIVFLGFAAYNLFAYGLRIAHTGEVSPTTQMIFYPYIYLVALGFLLLTLVVFMQFLKKVCGGEQE
jgi:TRAP-type C4-dicarboxylate transport system permease small subunit